MAAEPRLIIQIAQGGAVERQLAASPPSALEGGQVVVEVEPADEAGSLEAPEVGEVVLSVPSPETLVRESDEVRRVLIGAGIGAEPLVVVVEAAQELRDEELAAVLDAATGAPRPVILRVIRDG